MPSWLHRGEHAPGCHAKPLLAGFRWACAHSDPELNHTRPGRRRAASWRPRCARSAWRAAGPGSRCWAAGRCAARRAPANRRPLPTCLPRVSTAARSQRGLTRGAARAGLAPGRMTRGTPWHETCTAAGSEGPGARRRRCACVPAPAPPATAARVPAQPCRTRALVSCISAGVTPARTKQASHAYQTRARAGGQVMAELRLPKGPQVGEASARVLDWQLAHPAASAEDCRAWLRTQAP
jgi:hypothetical protein